MSPASHGALQLLLLGFGEEGELLAARLRQTGHRVAFAGGLEEAVHTVQRADPEVGAVLVPVDPPLPDLPQSLRYLSEISPLGELRFVTVGKRPDAARAERLRAAGVRLALFEPFTEDELRFIVNHAVYNPRRGERRVQTRVPTRLVARLATGAGEKDAFVYSLSAEGAYLHTDDPIQSGKDVEVELALPSGTLRLEARILSCNEPGTSYKRSVPSGMGIRFTALDPETREALEAFVTAQARTFQV